MIKRALVVLLAAGYTMGLLLVVVAYRSGLEQAAGWHPTAGTEGSPTEQQAAAAARNVISIEKKMAALRPAGIYIVVDTAANRLYLKNGDQVLRKAIVSCGSGEVLKDPKGKREWVFDTPRGEFSIKYKVKNPVWIKPDWAFIEEGTKIPPAGSEDRIEGGTLGNYALGLGNGYFIHGTLYTRLLGRNVTHGCIRVGDDDLEFVYKTMPLGNKVYIY